MSCLKNFSQALLSHKPIYDRLLVTVIFQMITLQFVTNLDLINQRCHSDTVHWKFPLCRHPHLAQPQMTHFQETAIKKETLSSAALDSNSSTRRKVAEATGGKVEKRRKWAEEQINRIKKTSFTSSDGFLKDILIFSVNCCRT